MRPLELTLKGLRSYREEATVNFSDVNLVAILGDTGSGKSSLLEAICLALYNSCSWSGSAAKPLLADGARSMHVALRFSVAGREWTVTRVVNRNTTPAVHQLVSEDGTERFDGEAAVKAQITRLVGLDRDSFLRAVILPQGRFDTLLRAPAGERTPMLEAILGIDQLDAIRDQAQSIRDRMAGPLQEVKVRRAALRTDPAGDAQRAAAEAERAEARLQDLNDTQAEISSARSAAADAADRARTLRAHVQNLGEIDPVPPANGLAELAELAATLDQSRLPLAEAAESSRAVADDLAGRLAAADAAGVGSAGLASVIATLEGLVGRLGSLGADADANDGRGRQLEADGAALDQLAGEVDTATKAVEGASDRATETAAAAQETRTHLVSATGPVETARRQIADACHAEALVDKAVEDLTTAEEALATVTAEVEKASSAMATAEEHLSDARRTDSAAAAAAGLHPGDDCPVCTRPLPDRFEAPTASGYTEAEKALKKATKLHTDAQRAEAKAEALAKQRHSELGKARQVAADAALAAGAAQESAAEVIGTFDPALPDADLLAGLVAAATDAATAAEEAHRSHLELAGEAERLKGRLASDEKAYKQASTELKKARARTASTRDQLDAAVAHFPQGLRPAVPLTVEAITTTLMKAGAEQVKIAELADEVRDAGAQANDASAALTAHDQRYRQEVTDQIGLYALPLDRLAERMGAAAATLDQPGPAVRSASAGLPALVEWAADLVGDAARLTEACEAAAGQADQKVRAAEVQVASALAQVEMVDEPALALAVVAVSADALNFRREQADAENQIAFAADLDHRLQVAAPLFEALEEVSALLARSKFRKWVVDRRQQTLLAVASEALAKMTGDRFGFTADFQIFDQVSGQARDPRTLSGGETFLASLALALTLVEMAGRSGRRQEALFLDEGFASLDSESLDDALEVLSDQAGGGRLVAVITHLRQVAENLEHVLWVTKTLGGSNVRPLSIAERDELLADEARSGLVA